MDPWRHTAAMLTGETMMRNGPQGRQGPWTLFGVVSATERRDSLDPTWLYQLEGVWVVKLEWRSRDQH
jgi:hypothetical protein